MAYNFQEHVDWDGVTPIDPNVPGDRKYYIYASDIKVIEDMLNLSFDISSSGPTSGMILGVRNDWYASGMMSTTQIVTNQFSVLDDDGFNIVDANVTASGLTIGSAGREYDVDIWGNVHMHSEIDGVSKFTINGYTESDRPITFIPDSNNNLFIVNEASYTYPSVTYNIGEGHYEATCCICQVGDTVYRVWNSAIDAYDICGFYKIWDQQPIPVGIPSSLISPEPQYLYSGAFEYTDGTVDLDIVLLSQYDSINRLTMVIPTTDTDTILELFIEMFHADKIIRSAFIAHGSNEDYEFDLAALTSESVILWGGDGANGERDPMPEQTVGITASEINVNDSDGNNILDVSGSGIVVGSLSQPYDIYSTGDIAASGMTAKNISITDSEDYNVVDAGNIASGLTIGSAGREYDVDIYGNVHMHSTIDGVEKFVLNGYTESDRPVTLRVDLSGTIETVNEASTSPILPSLTFGSELYNMLACIIQYPEGGTIYNYPLGEGDRHYCHALSSRPFASGGSVTIGTLEAEELETIEPKAMYFGEEPFGSTEGFDGEHDIDIVLGTLGESGVTFFVASNNREAVITALESQCTIIEFPATGLDYIRSVFIAPTNQDPAGTPMVDDYEFNESAITEAGAVLWSGDGAGGSRTVILPEQIAGITTSQINLSGPIINNNTVTELDGVKNITVDTFDCVDLDVMGCVWNYALRSSDCINYRAGTIMACWETASYTVAFDDASTLDIGDTSQFEFNVTAVGYPDIDLEAVISDASLWDVSFSRNLLKNIPTG